MPKLTRISSGGAWGVTEEARAKARVNALAITLTAALMGVMLNAVTTSNITG